MTIPSSMDLLYSGLIEVGGYGVTGPSPKIYCLRDQEAGTYYADLNQNGIVKML